MKRYPLLLKPIVKDYIWGGTRLKTDFLIDSDLEILAEAWMLSCHKEGTNLVINGEFSGKRLDEVLREWNEFDSTFPILIKLIDASDKLSIQVHPNDSYALQKEGEFGKTEMWYVIDALPDSKLVYGFNRNIDKQEFKERIENNSLDEVLNYVNVKKGDVFFIPSGTLHAIGAGILIAEIQQNSNTTYRVSDYGRLGIDGKLRQLHVEKALEVTNTEPMAVSLNSEYEVITHSYGSEKILAECEYFKSSVLELDGELKLSNKDSFLSVLVLEGEIQILYGDERIKAVKSESIYIPSDFSCEISGSAKLILSKKGKLK